MPRHHKFTIEGLLRELLGEPSTPRSATIRRKARIATLFAAALVVPSVCMVHFHRIAERENEPGWATSAEHLWIIHAASVIVAISLWIFEKPRKIAYVSDLPSPQRDDEKAPLKIRQRNLLILFLMACAFCGGLTYVSIMGIISSVQRPNLLGLLSSGGGLALNLRIASAGLPRLWRLTLFTWRQR